MIVNSMSCGQESQRVTTRVYLQEETKHDFYAYVCSSILPSQIGVIFILQTPFNFSTPHTKFEQDFLTQS